MSLSSRPPGLSLARWILASTSIEFALSANTYGQRLRMLRVFLDRIIEWTGPTPCSRVT